MFTFTHEKNPTPWKRVLCSWKLTPDQIQQSFFFLIKSSSLTRNKIYMRLLMYEKELYAWESKWGKYEK